VQTVFIVKMDKASAKNVHLVINALKVQLPLLSVVMDFTAQVDRIIVRFVQLVVSVSKVLNCRLNALNRLTVFNNQKFA